MMHTAIQSTTARFLPQFDPSPPIVVQEVRFANAVVSVIRDDLLAGGTKQRGLDGLLKTYRANGSRQLVYASPFCGYAQIALAVLCKELELECVLFCETDPHSATGALSTYSQVAKSYGARIRTARTLKEASRYATDFCDAHQGYLQVPLGFDCPEFYRHYTAALTTQWNNLLRGLGREPDNLWISLGSGTLARSFLHVLEGRNTTIQAVNVHVLADDDQRLKRLTVSNRVRLHSADKAFRTAEERVSAFPSNIFYDAKVGPFLDRLAKSGDVMWNVAH